MCTFGVFENDRGGQQNSNQTKYQECEQSHH
jgi:hypothetical protein